MKSHAFRFANSSTKQSWLRRSSNRQLNDYLGCCLIACLIRCFIVFFIKNIIQTCTRCIILSVAVASPLAYASNLTSSTTSNLSSKSASKSASNNQSADFAQCSHHFAHDTPPSLSLVTSTSSTDEYALCFAGFAVLYSANDKNPLWSAEYLTNKRLYQASKRERVDNFHEERRILIKDRANLADYKKSGYDRGHLAPNADMATLQQQYDSFSLANIVPQSPHLNRSVWKDIEATTRYYVKKHQHAYVVTGAFSTPSPQSNNNSSAKLNGAVTVPSHLYKAIYLPESLQAGVYVAHNDESARIALLSLTEFQQQTGINAFPQLPKPIALLSVNPPTHSTHDTSNAHPDNQGLSSDAEQLTDNSVNRPWWQQFISAMFTWLQQQLQQ